MSIRKSFCLIAVFVCSSFVFPLQSQTVFRGKITDENTQEPIVGAKIGITDQGVGVVTAQNGNFNYRKYHQTLGNTSVLKISAAGYVPIEINQWDIRELFNKSSKIVMTPKASTSTNSKKEIKKLKVFWDASLSETRRDFQKEWGFLVSYLQTLDDAAVTLTVFNDHIALEETFTSGTDLQVLKEKIAGMTREGATDYSLLEMIDTDAVLLFSDGDGVLGEVQPSRDIPIHIISSVARADQEYIEALAAYTSGTYVNLATTSYSKGLDQIASGLLTQKDIAPSKKLNGTVFNGDTPVQGARIFIKGDLEEFTSSNDGSFSVPAEVGDVIQINHFGMYSREMIVSDLEPMQVTLKTLDELLEEVVIKGKKRVLDKNKANTGYGAKSKDAVGVSVNTLLGSDISTSAQSMADAIRGRFAGVRVNGFGQDATIIIREGNSQIPPIWVVDGSIYQDQPNFIDPQIVASVSIVKGIFATSRYGSIASGGAIIVNTNNLELKDRSGFKDLALVKDNDYEENLEALNLSQLVPDYIKQLEALPNAEARYKRYLNLVKANESNASFFIDMALYFQKEDPEIAKKVRATITEKAHKNGQILRVVAYLYDAARDAETSLKLYERIAKLLPSEAQSYRDLARAYVDNGHYDQALELYINMLGEQILGITFKEIDVVLSHELLSLTARYGDQLDMSRLPDDFKGQGFDLDIRMTLEYSNKEAPFEFQFVSPADKFYKFNHTLLDNRDRLEVEEKNGFQIEEFVVDDADHGLWKVNLEYLGDKTSEILPNYIKYTIYWDYGTSAQRQEVIVLKLTPEIKKGQFYEFLI